MSFFVNGRYSVGAIAERCAERCPEGRWAHIQVFPSDGASAISLIVVYGWPDGNKAKNTKLFQAAWDSATRGTNGDRIDPKLRLKFQNYTTVCRHCIVIGL